MSGFPPVIRELVSGIPVPLMLVGNGMKILVANEEAEKFYNAKLEGTSLYVYLRQPEAMGCIQQVVNGHSEVTSRISEIRNEFEISLNLKVKRLHLDQEEQPVLLISFHDVTYIDEAEEMRRDFVANVSHELRSPLTALSGFIETLSTESWDNRKIREKFLKIMADEADRMRRLVTNLLSLSKVEASERLPPTTPVNLLEIIDISQHSMRHISQRFEVPVVVDCECSDLLIHGDKDQLIQVFNNLLENAIKYSTKNSKVWIECDIDRCGPEQSFIRVDVRDRGRGFDPIHIPRVTERFYRVDKHRSREMSGTGLGLAIVKHIVNRHRGRLLIESQDGEGSVFTVLLPLTKAGEMS